MSEKVCLSSKGMDGHTSTFRVSEKGTLSTIFDLNERKKWKAVEN
jgi:hypothetical protein